MRVLTIVKDFDIGGTQRVAQNLTLGVQRAGIDVAVLGYHKRGSRERFYREREVPVFGPEESQSSDSVNEALRWRPDIVHIHRTGYPDQFETRLLREFRSHGARIVETNVFARYDQTEAHHLIDVHCLLSRWCWMKWTMWRSNRDDSAATILPNAVDVGRFARLGERERQALRAALGVPASRFLFGRIGQPISSKWSPEIFPAFSEAVARGGDLGLLLVGAPNEYKRLVANLERSTRDRILMIDAVDDDARLSGFYSVMDAFIHLSEIGESFGMVLCEALLCGTPVITLSTPLRDNSQLEVVGHERGGLIALDLKGVVEAMVRIQGDQSLRMRVQTEGRAWVADRFAVDVVASRAIHIYEALMAAADKADLQKRLNALGAEPPDLDWLNAIQLDGLGAAPTCSQKIFFRLLHVPQIYRAFQLLKTGVLGVRR